MFIYHILTSGYKRFIDLLVGNNKKYTNKDVILKMTMFGIILLLLSFLSTYYIPYTILILMSISK